MEFIEGMQFKNKPHTLNLTEHEGIIQTWLICADCAFHADCCGEQHCCSDFTACSSGLYQPLKTLLVFQSCWYFWRKLGLQLVRLEKIGDSVRYLMKPIYYVFTVQFYIGKSKTLCDFILRDLIHPTCSWKYSLSKLEKKLFRVSVR